jgi:ABC-type glycerol-3-phosphate transport system substrate-binding protein
MIFSLSGSSLSRGRDLHNTGKHHEETSMKIRYTALALAAATLALQSAWAGEPEAKKWIDSEFQPSTLSKEQQTAEMKWFIDAAKKLQGKGVREISVVSETITTHEYESKTLAKAFEEITGIKVKHDLIQEGDVVEKLQTSMQSGKSIYDGWISDSDLIGTHYRYGKIMNLTDYMAGKGKEYTNPGLDLKDFIGTKFTTGPDGKLYQLPDQQFANLYWFRADLFARPDLKEKFKAKYGYDLGVPLNWSAYEDIAEFFSVDVKTIDGKPIYGHMDYGKKDPSLGWRFTDAWLSMAGTADIGAPNGVPIDEWGIRVGDDKCTPVGASVSRGGATNSPAAVYALTKYIDWMKKYAPKEATGMTFGEAGPVPAQGQIAQQIFWYTAFTADMTKAGPAGGQRRRHAQVAHGARAERPVLEAGHAERLPGRGLVDLLRRARREPHGRRLALRAVHHLQDHLAQEDHRGPHAHPRVRHPVEGHDRHRAQAGRPGRVLPQSGARRLVADRHQRARLPQAGPALVEERGRRR